MELKGECERNPGFMYRHCPFSCNVCEFRKTLPPGKVKVEYTCLHLV